MKTCHIYPVSASATGAYQWKWKCIEGKRQSGSSRAFDLFYECVEDARSHGVDVDLERAPDQIAESVNVKVAAPPPKPSKRSKASKSQRA